jgi:hypothetical protein
MLLVLGMFYYHSDNRFVSAVNSFFKIEECGK